MPSVTDVQQQSSNNNEKSTSSSQQISTDTTNVDPITQAILVLEKKQINLVKRKVIFFLKKFFYSNFNSRRN
jgi:hypothetical protein